MSQVVVEPEAPRPAVEPTGVVRFLRANEGALRVAGFLLMGVAVVLWIRQLPANHAMLLLTGYVDRLGPLGPLLFAAVYVVAVVLVLPGSMLTLAAGATFGFAIGLPTALLSATVGATLAFLISRYVARDAVARLAGRRRAFRAVDRAVGEGGWRMVVLLRVSPLIPFNVLNYVMGVTRVRLRGYVVGSMLGMLPGSLVWSYIGAFARQAALEEGRGLGSGKVILGLVGLSATVAVTTYVAVLARRHLREEAAVPVEPQEAAPPDEAEDPLIPALATRLKPSTVAVPLVAGALLLALPLSGWANRLIRDALGPPAVQMVEAHTDAPGDAAFDHGPLDALLRAHVDADGLVDYAGLHRDRAALDAYVASLAEAPYEQLSRDGKLALLINAYNAFMLQLVLDSGPVENILRDIEQPFRKARWTIAGEPFSLDRLEHETIRAQFIEPRIHWAVVCGAISCPPLRAEAYTPERLEAQLSDQARRVHEDERFVRFDGRVLRVTPLFDWYAGDFEQAEESVLTSIGRLRPDVARAVAAGEGVRLEFLPYDWTLNDQANRDRLEALRR